MSRAVKFRAWSKDDMEVRGPWYGGFSIHATGKVEQTAFVPGDIFVVEQFTGLLDAKGVEVYEGDILTSEWNDSYRYSIQWNERLARFTMVSHDGHDDEEMHPSDCIQVIGNIHETPELLS